jgi:hypothetical protein
LREGNAKQMSFGGVRDILASAKERVSGAKRSSVAKRKSEGDFAVPNELWRALGPRKGSRGKLHASDGFPWGFWFLYLKLV